MRPFIAKTLLICSATIALMSSSVKAVQPWERVQFSTAAITSQGFTSVIPAQGTNLKILVYSYEVSCSTGVFGTTFALATQSNAAGNILTSTKTISSTGLYISPYNPNGSVITPANQSLGVNIGTSSPSCGVDITWQVLWQ